MSRPLPPNHLERGVGTVEPGQEEVVEVGGARTVRKVRKEGRKKETRRRKRKDEKKDEKKKEKKRETEPG